MIGRARLVRRSLWFHWRSHLGVVIGSAVGSAALVGALVVGDSVRHSLLEKAANRLGGVELALYSGDRLFGSDLAERLAPARNVSSPDGGGSLDWGRAGTGRAQTLLLRGVATRQDGTARAHDVQILGSEPRFWGLSPREIERLASVHARGPEVTTAPGGGPGLPEAGDLAIEMSAWYRPAPGAVRINTALADQLGAKPGETIILRFAKPSALSPDAVLSPRNDASAAMRLVVDDVVDDSRFGAFALRSGQRPALNAFVNQADLAKAAGVTNRANLLLVGGGMTFRPPTGWRARVNQWCVRHPTWLPEPLAKTLIRWTSPFHVSEPAETERMLRHVEAELGEKWRLDDAEVQVRVIEQPLSATGGEWVRPMVEVSTRRIFLDPPVVTAATTPSSQADAGFVTNGVPLITYLANAIRTADRLTPYSMVCAAGAPWTPADLGADEIVVNEWLAGDLGVKVGDTIQLVYFDPEAGARLVERTNAFRVKEVVPLRGLHGDRTLMPEFPGLAKSESTADWDAGFPLVHRIRDQDEAYWKEHRGTPKAFVSLEAGRRMWGNRFGEFTAVRYPIPEASFPSGFQRVVESNLRANLRPADVGLQFQAVRDQAFRAATSGQDFGQLFLGFSFFLVAAALLLMALLFRFGLEQRLGEVGTLLALGWKPGVVRRLWLGEAMALASVGGILGVVAGVGYAAMIIDGLGTVWRSAVGGAALGFHVTPASVGVGLVSSVIVCVAVIGFSSRRQFARPARELLAGEIAGPRSGRGSRGRWVGMSSLGLAVVLVGWALATGDTANAGVFFGAGSLLLVAGLAFVSGWLGTLQGVGGSGGEVSRSDDRGPVFTLRGLAVRGTARRRSRSVATTALLACGTFLVLAIGVFRMDADRDASRRDSGTGGFAFIGETSLPVVQDLNTEAGRDAFGLDGRTLEGTSVVPFRVREGDEASCLNLDRAQRPRLLGVNPEALAGRGAFTFATMAKALGVTNGWLALKGPKVGGAGSADVASSASVVPEVPAIGDAASIQWALGKKIGDTLEMSDERGRVFRLRLVAGVANSILQGSLVIDEAEFVKLFPGEAGARWFLVDAPSSRAADVAAALSRALEDVGLELTPAARRLGEFQAVQNTYLSTFQVLGGLGLLLGSLGLGVVVLRNVLERRGELAVLTATGFRRRTVTWLVLGEHAVLLGLGLAIGIASAAVAVLPALGSAGSEWPWRSLGLTLIGMLVLGMATTWAATRVSVRGHLLAALRGE